MRNWRAWFALLILCVISQSASCQETLTEAITRIYYSPLDSENYHPALLGEMLENHRVASAASKPLFNTPANALCLCSNPADISLEVRRAVDSDSRFAEAQITLNEKNRSRWLTLKLYKVHDRWQVSDVDSIDDDLPSLVQQLRDDTQKKLVISPQLATDSRPIIEVSISELLAHPDKYHQRKVRVRGQVQTGFEKHAIYSDSGSKDKGLWLEEILVPYTSPRNHVPEERIIEGTFDMRITGHLGQYPGGITAITRYEKIDAQKETPQVKTQGAME